MPNNPISPNPHSCRFASLEEGLMLSSHGSFPDAAAELRYLPPSCAMSRGRDKADIQRTRHRLEQQPPPLLQKSCPVLNILYRTLGGLSA